MCAHGAAAERGGGPSSALRRASTHTAPLPSLSALSRSLALAWPKRDRAVVRGAAVPAALCRRVQRRHGGARGPAADQHCRLARRVVRHGRLLGQGQAHHLTAHSALHLRRAALLSGEQWAPAQGLLGEGSAAARRAQHCHVHLHRGGHALLGGKRAPRRSEPNHAVLLLHTRRAATPARSASGARPRSSTRSTAATQRRPASR